MNLHDDLGPGEGRKPDLAYWRNRTAQDVGYRLAVARPGRARRARRANTGTELSERPIIGVTERGDSGQKRRLFHLPLNVKPAPAVNLPTKTVRRR